MVYQGDQVIRRRRLWVPLVCLNMSVLWA
jgi:hypothetical protein